MRNTAPFSSAVDFWTDDFSSNNCFVLVDAVGYVCSASRKYEDCVLQTVADELTLSPNDNIVSGKLYLKDFVVVTESFRTPNMTNYTH